jgi:two-component system chemotaxis response regulator CheB
MKVRVLVVEDSVTVRRHLCEALKADPTIDVVGDAGDGKQAIHLCETLRPDVVTMDMMLPVMTGLGATEYIMAHCPTPILIVSASTNRGEVFKTYEALAAGAIDVLEKPNGTEPEGTWEQNLRATVKLVSRVRTVTHVRARLGSLAQPRPALLLASANAHARAPHRVVAIGASTGGPSAVLDVLRALPGSFPLPILLVLHINEPFAAAFAEWLDGQTDFRVSYAADGQPLDPASGRVLMAPPGLHLAVRAGRLRLTQDPERHSCRPAVDVLFESLAAECGASTAACLLTGMGRDGAAGLLAIRRAGGTTIAQDEASSVVYGMPREAILLGAAERVLSLADIGPALASLAELRAHE